MSAVKVDQIFKDNDPRMSRHVRITALIEPNRVEYIACTITGGVSGANRYHTALARRFYFDGKPRRNGFSFVREITP